LGKAYTYLRMTTVKVAYRGDIRRVAVTDYASLVKFITVSFGVDNFVIKYVDEDDDRISVASDFELAEALRHAEGKKMLKLLVFIPKKGEPDMEKQQLQQLQHQVNEKKEIEKQEAEKQKAENKEAEAQKTEVQGDAEEEEEDKQEESEGAEKEAEVSKEVKDPLDHDSNCSLCSKPIIGVLYRCSVCPHINLCAGCEEANMHDSEHTLIKVRAPPARQPERQPRAKGGMKWKWCSGLKMVKKASIVLIALFVLRALPFLLAVLGVWATFQFAKRRRRFLRQCADCTHAEGCHLGRLSKKMKHCKVSKDWRCGLAIQAAFLVGCLLARALPLCLVLPPLVLAMLARRSLRKFKKGFCNDVCGHQEWTRAKEVVRNLTRSCEELDRTLWKHICAIYQNPRTVKAAVAAAAAAAMNEVQRADGIQIPVAVPPSAAGPAFEQQTRLLKEMGFEITAALQQLLVKHNGNLPAVITEFVSMNKKQT